VNKPSQGTFCKVSPDWTKQLLVSPNHATQDHAEDRQPL